MAYKTVAIDFDKTLAQYESGDIDRHGYGSVGDPLPGAIAFLKTMKKAGFNIKILSARAAEPVGKKAIEKWVEKYAPGLVDGVTHEKLPGFDVYIDDRAIHFDGDYKATMKELLRRTRE